MSDEFAPGDYVLATKYHDGDTGDQYALGFYHSQFDHYGQTRFMVVDRNGKQFRGNGFRRIEKVTHDEGVWLMEHDFTNLPLTAIIETGDAENPTRMEGTVWDWLEKCRDALRSASADVGEKHDD